MLEDRRQIDGPHGSRASNGQPYVTFCISGPKEEGAQHPIAIKVINGDTKAGEKAVMTLLESEIDAYFADKPGVIEWRERPQIVADGDMLFGWARLARGGSGDV